MTRDLISPKIDPAENIRKEGVLEASPMEEAIAGGTEPPEAMT
jgi:hypothetical protein